MLLWCAVVGWCCADAKVLKVYDNLSTNVERADLWRYLALHEYGGVYAGEVSTPVHYAVAYLLQCVQGIPKNRHSSWTGP